MKDLNEDYRMFYGTEKHYKHGLFSDFLYTDGVQAVCKDLGAYWFLDTIALTQFSHIAVNREEFQIWKAVTDKNNSVTITVQADSGLPPIKTIVEDYTSLPTDSILTFWLVSNSKKRVALLPSEY